MLRAASQYQDFMFTMVKPRKQSSGPLKLIKNKRSGRFYPTRARQLRNGEVEVTFNLPPEILRQMQQAIMTGKRIRLFVP